jgi:hypothetical protein
MVRAPIIGDERPSFWCHLPEAMALRGWWHSKIKCVEATMPARTQRFQRIHSESHYWLLRTCAKVSVLLDLHLLLVDVEHHEKVQSKSFKLASSWRYFYELYEDVKTRGKTERKEKDEMLFRWTVTLIISECRGDCVRFLIFTWLETEITVMWLLWFDLKGVIILLTYWLLIVDMF